MSLGHHSTLEERHTHTILSIADVFPQFTVYKEAFFSGSLYVKLSMNDTIYNHINKYFWQNMKVSALELSIKRIAHYKINLINFYFWQNIIIVWWICWICSFTKNLLNYIGYILSNYFSLNEHEFVDIISLYDEIWRKKNYSSLRKLKCTMHVQYLSTTVTRKYNNIIIIICWSRHSY